MRVAVAASGGRDSTALLHCTLRMARPLGVQVVALHVHHGLQPAADDWLAHLRRQTARWARAGWPLSFAALRLAGAPQRGDSVEGWARRERYAALAAMAREHDCRLVLLAHHREDQAETVLLQALRGAGAAGLAAMPRQIERDGIVWCRPWLEQPRQAIADYVERWRLSYVDDPSNADARYARSRLRRRVWPALLQAFPDAATSLAMVARQAQGARACLAELASIDRQAVQQPDGALRLAQLERLSPPRRANLLRHWLQQHAGSAALPQTLIERLLAELPRSSSGEWPGPGGRLRVHRGALHWVADTSSSKHADTEPQAATPRDASPIDLSMPGRHVLPGWRGSLLVQPADAGLPATRLRLARCAERRGGERFRLYPATTERPLKKQYQALGVPAWQRDGPLIFDGEQLLFVPGLGIDGRAWRSGEGGLVALRWIRDDAAG